MLLLRAVARRIEVESYLKPPHYGVLFNQDIFIFYSYCLRQYFLFVYISCAFLWEAGFDRRLPFLAYRHLANRYYYFCCLLQCFIYNVSAGRCSLLSGRNDAIV